MSRFVALVLALLTATMVDGMSKSSDAATLILEWTAPGDDAGSGRATRYDIRYATFPITAETFAQATPAFGSPLPSDAGTSERFTVGGLLPRTRYWFAIRTVDDAANWSEISNVPDTLTLTPTDSIPPARITLSSIDSTETSVTLAWFAPGDDSLTGTASRYDLRSSRQRITDVNWTSSSPVSGEPAPAAPGTRQTMTITGLDRNAELYFAAKAIDDESNASALSNVVTLSRTIDVAPPSAPVGLATSIQGSGQGRLSIRLVWTPSAAPDLAGYNVYRSVAASGPLTRMNATLLTVPDYLDTSIPDTASAVRYQTTAVDRVGNESPKSAVHTFRFDRTLVSGLGLETGYPNPSRLSETVRLPLRVPAGHDGTLTVVIANSAGEIVRRIGLTGLKPGITDVLWDGRNDAGRPTAPGAYHAWIAVGSTRQSTVGLVRVP